MKKNLLLSLVFLLVCFGLVATASADGVDIELTCPTTVKANQPLIVRVYLYNWDCSSSIPVSRLMMGLVGNANSTLGGAGIWGPYNRPISTRTLAPATCDAYGTTPTSDSFSLQITSAVPTSLLNTMAMAMVSAITSTGETFGGGECLVAVVP